MTSPASAAGRAGVARVGADLPDLLARLRPGDVAVVDVTDVDRATAETLVAAGVTAVVNAGQLSPGRYANLGPRILAEAGVVWLDGAGSDALVRIHDGVAVRVQEGVVHPSGVTGRVLNRGLDRGLDRGLPAPGTESVRPSGAELPEPATRITGRPALLVGRGRHGDLRAVRRFVRERGPVVVALEGAADDLVGLSWVPDIVVTSHGGGGGPDRPGVPADADAARDRPSADALALARDVVAVRDGQPVADVALRLLDRRDASVVVGVGLPPTVEVPSARVTGAGTWLLDARALPLLGSGRAGSTRFAVAIAALIALGVGIALGIGPLARPATRSSDVDVAATGSDAAEAREAEATDRFAQRFAEAGAGRLYADGLAGHGIVVLSVPGASAASVRALVAQVEAAGGSATRTIALRPALFSAAGQAQVDAVGARLVGQLTDPRVDASASAYVRMGQLIAVATTTSVGSAEAPDPVATSVRDALASAGLVEFPVEVRLAPLVLLVLPDGTAGAGRQPAGALAGLLTGLATSAAGVVVAGDADSASDGLLAGLRRQPAPAGVSTVDGVDAPLGRATAVLALEALLSGSTGSFGQSGADGPVPLS